MTPGVGSLSWARRTRGGLSAADRLRLLAQAMLARVASALPRRARPPIEVAALRVPDSALATGAADHLRSVAEPWLVNHCWRTYLWGWLLGSAERRTFDEEELLVAALLHDLGLTGTPDPTIRCFAVEGAFAAERFLDARAVAEERRQRIADAIALHMNPRVAPGLGAEAHLLHEGAAMDVIGARRGEISGSTRRAVLDRHPRLGMKAGIAARMKEQSALRPESRAALLCSVGFLTMIRRAPFEDGP